MIGKPGGVERGTKGKLIECIISKWYGNVPALKYGAIIVKTKCCWHRT